MRPALADGEQSLGYIEQQPVSLAVSNCLSGCQ